MDKQINECQVFVRLWEYEVIGKIKLSKGCSKSQGIAISLAMPWTIVEKCIIINFDCNPHLHNNPRGNICISGAVLENWHVPWGTLDSNFDRSKPAGLCFQHRSPYKLHGPHERHLRHVRTVRPNWAANFRGPPFWTQNFFGRPINYVCQFQQLWCVYGANTDIN